jgi:hypothetical protein
MSKYYEQMHLSLMTSYHPTIIPDLIKVSRHVYTTNSFFNDYSNRHSVLGIAAPMIVGFSWRLSSRIEGSCTIPIFLVTLKVITEINPLSDRLLQYDNEFFWKSTERCCRESPTK